MKKNIKRTALIILTAVLLAAGDASIERIAQAGQKQEKDTDKRVPDAMQACNDPDQAGYQG